MAVASPMGYGPPLARRHHLRPVQRRADVGVPEAGKGAGK
jgi:hypothetical protein